MEEPKGLFGEDFKMEDKNFFLVTEDNNLLYNVEVILEYLKNIHNEKFFIKQLCNIIKEERNDIMINILREIGKDCLLGLIERSLRIENSGGVNRKDNKNLNEGRKTIGGIIMGYARKECGLTNQQKNKIFLKDNSYVNQKRKIRKMMKKMEV